MIVYLGDEFAGEAFILSFKSCQDATYPPYLQVISS